MKWMKEKGFKTEREMRLWCSANYIQFWDEMARTYADWFEPCASTLEWKPPYARWFVGGKTNMTYNSVDRHAKSAKKDKVAYIFVPEPTDQPTRKITYGELYKVVNKFANGVKCLGVKKGDRITLYMPMIPQLPIAMLASAKIGAIHSIVFSGFSSGGLAN
jgi:acetyl-CoA synthetase